MSRAIHSLLARLRPRRRWGLRAIAFLTRWDPRASRDRLILVSGFHHTGTTLVQAQLARQGVFTPVEDATDGSPRRPQELPLRYLHRLERAARRAGQGRFMTKRTTNRPRAVRRLANELRLLAPECTVVICQRDPAATALSVSGRLGWDPERALADADAQRSVADAWRDYAGRHRGPVHFLSLEDFTREPERHLRSILQLDSRRPLPAPLETAANAEATPGSLEDTLPNPLRNSARRRVQSQLPIYPVDRDAWMATEDPGVLAVLREIREHFGTSPSS